MRKTNLFGATFLALTASVWSLAAVAQTAAPAPAAPPAPEPPAASAPATPDATPAPAAGDTSAPAEPKSAKKHMAHHKMMHGHGKLAATPAGNKAVEDLNSASLDAAKTGKPFVAPATPAAAKMTAHTGNHRTHHMSKPKGDATAPTAPADTSSTPPADTSGK